MARVYISTVIGASAADVWARVRDFNALPRWHPRIRDSRIEDALPGDKTVLMIAHRLSTIRNADRICILENAGGEGARVVEQGGAVRPRPSTPA